MKTSDTRKPAPASLAQSQAEHAAIRAEIVAKAKVKGDRAFTVFLALCCLLAISWFRDPEPDALVYFVILFFALSLASAFTGRDRWLTQGEYYSISGSRDSDGQHRCIFCGNKGIYRQGEYAGNTTYARCSKCQEPLFYH